MAVSLTSFATLVLSLGALTVLASCNDETESPAPEPSGTGTAAVGSLPESSGGGAGAPGGVLPEGESLRAMVEYYESVIIGTVLRETGTTYFLGEGVPQTKFEVEVNEVVAGNQVKPGDRITLLVSGGPLLGGRHWEDGGTYMPLAGSVEPGKRYLMFVSDGTIVGYPGFFGDPGARFELTDDDRLIPNFDDTYPASYELVGTTEADVRAAASSLDADAALEALARVTVAEAAAKIRAAIGEGPLPDPPLWLVPWVEYWKTNPTPTPAGIPATPASEGTPTPTAGSPTNVPEVTPAPQATTPTKAP